MEIRSKGVGGMEGGRLRRKQFDQKKRGYVWWAFPDKAIPGGGGAADRWHLPHAGEERKIPWEPNGGVPLFLGLPALPGEAINKDQPHPQTGLSTHLSLV